MPARVSTTPARPQSAFYLQPQEYPLNHQALTSLDNLKKHDTPAQNTALQDTLDRAAQLLTDAVGQLNDRANEERTRRQTRQQKLRRDGQTETEEEKQEFKLYQEKVEALTKTMDESARKLVDDQQFPKNSAIWVQHVVDKSKEFAQIDEEDEEGTVQNQPPGLDPSQSGTTMLHAARSTAETEWNAQSLTQRYARNNTYADFYKMVWDSKNHSDHPPPLPDPSIWFALQEGRNPGRNTQRSTQRSATATGNDEDEEDKPTQDTYDEEDTEIQMTSDVRSVRCPLTTRYFSEPMTSTLCPHSFEKSAILMFIRESDKRTPLTAEQENELNSRHPRGSKGRPHAEAMMRNRNPKCVQCPVPGCAVTTLTENDLRFDNVLLRMTKRAQDAERREQEEDGDGPEELDDDTDDELPGSTQRRKKRVYTVGSSPVRNDGRRRTLVKPERAVSVVPNSQAQTQSQDARSRGRGGFVVNDDDDEDEDEDMDE